MLFAVFIVILSRLTSLRLKRSLTYLLTYDYLCIIFSSGGIQLTITGKNFYVVSQPRMIVTVAILNNQSDQTNTTVSYQVSAGCYSRETLI